jgi:hypothetical protein
VQEVRMQHYRFHFFDHHNVRIRVRTWSGRDDLDALDAAQKFSTRYAVEVWQGDRRVARVNLADGPLRTLDRQSL